MNTHPLCHTLWHTAQAITRHGADAPWLACGGWTLLRAGMRDPQGPREVSCISVHHPAPISMDSQAQERMVALARALLILEGWHWRGAFALGGLTTLSPVDPCLSAHRLLPIVDRFNSHMRRLGWTGSWTNTFHDTLDNVMGFGAVAADPTFDPNTYRAARLAV